MKSCSLAEMLVLSAPRGPYFFREAFTRRIRSLPAFFSVYCCHQLLVPLSGDPGDPGGPRAGDREGLDIEDSEAANSTVEKGRRTGTGGFIVDGGAR